MLPEIVATLDALPELLVILESGGSIVAANHRFARTFDGSPEGLIGRSLFDLLETHPERARAYLRRCAGTMQPMPGALVFRRSNGEPLECQCSGAALRPGGEFGPKDDPPTLSTEKRSGRQFCRAKSEDRRSLA